MEKYCTLVIVDYRVVVFSLYYQYQTLKASDLGRVFLDNWLKASWATVLHRGPTALPYIEEQRIVVVSDASPYWKSQYLADRGFPQYKGGRADKTADWYEVNAAGIKYLSSPNCPIDFIEIPSYEADDIAGALVRLNPGRLYLLNTIDSDWQGLVADGELNSGQSIEYLSSDRVNIEPTVVWCNLQKWTPRIRTEEGVREHTLRRMGVQIEKPPEMWEAKTTQGDKSDNLPPGSPIEVISLLSPPPEFDLLNHNISPYLKEVANNPNPNNSVTHLHKALNWFEKSGLTPPLFELNKHPLPF